MVPSGLLPSTASRRFTQEPLTQRHRSVLGQQVLLHHCKIADSKTSPLPASVACNISGPCMQWTHAATPTVCAEDKPAVQCCDLPVSVYESRHSLRLRLSQQHSSVYFTSRHMLQTTPSPAVCLCYCRSFSWTSMSFCTRCSSAFRFLLSLRMSVVGNLVVSVLLCVLRLSLACW